MGKRREIEEQGKKGVGGVVVVEGAERLEIEIYDIENDYDGDRARSHFALPSLVAVNLAMRADQTKIGC